MNTASKDSGIWDVYVRPEQGFEDICILENMQLKFNQLQERAEVNTYSIWKLVW